MYVHDARWKTGHNGQRQELTFIGTIHCVGHDIWSGDEGSRFDTGTWSQDICSQGECVLFDGATRHLHAML